MTYRSMLGWAMWGAMGFLAAAAAAISLCVALKLGAVVVAP